MSLENSKPIEVLPLRSALSLPGSPVQEHHIDFLLEEEFACNPLFLAFFIEQARAQFEPIEHGTVLTPRLESPCQAIRSVTSDKGETDVLVIYQSEAGRTAILIENKIRAGFQLKQAERYRTRGEAGKPKHWDSFWTCLIAPDQYAATNSGFDTRVSIASLKGFFDREDARSRFKANVLGSAMRRFDETGLRIKDETVTRFRAWYSIEAEKLFAPDEIVCPRPRDAWWGDTWFNFKGGNLPKRSEIVYKAGPGFVDFAFRNTRVEIAKELLSRCQDNESITAVQTGKSAAFRLQLQGISDFASGPALHSTMQDSLNCVRKLLSFSEKNRNALLVLTSL